MKVYAFLRVVLVIQVAVWLAGCGAAPTAVPPGEKPNMAQSQSAEVRELQEVTMTPIPTTEAAEVTPPPEAEQVVKLAREDLAKRLGLSSEDMRLVSVEAVEWSDASLGCPQPGMMYAQVITPGFRVVLEAEGGEYKYHTDQGDPVVLCEPEAGGGATPPASGLEVSGGELPALAEPPPGAEAVVRMAVEDLAKRLGVAPEAIQLVSVRAMEWSDTSLGCPQPGMMYAQVITPGFRVVLEAEGQQYEYHTDEGRFVVLCEAKESSIDPEPLMPVAPQEKGPAKP